MNLPQDEAHRDKTIPRRSFRRNFSLIELLVVISILSTLSLLLQPALKKTLTKAVQMKCFTNMKELGQWVWLFSEDNNSMWPRHNTSGAIWPGRWYFQLKPYSEYPDTYQTFEGYQCPAKSEDTLNWTDKMYGINQELSCQDTTSKTNKVFHSKTKL